MNRTNRALVGAAYAVAIAYAAIALALTIMSLGNDPATSIPGIASVHGPYSGFLSGIPLGGAVAAAGFAVSVLGMLAPFSLDVKGTDNPVEFLWTHRPGALVRCVLAPWGLIPELWSRNRALAVLPILALPLYAVWSAMISCVLLIPFVVERLIVSAKISSAEEKERIRYRTETQFAVCPDCKRRFSRPKAVCRCGLLIDYPVPGPHGITSQTCNNGDEIPCTAGNRVSLKTACPYCRRIIPTREALPICVSMAGPTGSGKTTLVLAAVETITGAARRCGIPCETSSDGLSEKTIAAKDSADRTMPGDTESLCLFLKPHGENERELVFNDISGSEFEPTEDRQLFEEYYRYADGTVFVLDPTSEDCMSRLMDAFDAFYGVYTTVRGESPGSPSGTRLAVAATRRDATGMDDGDVRSFLMDNGHASFVSSVESLFPEHAYFSVRSVGSDCGTAAAPVLWIMQGADRSLSDRISKAMRPNK